MICYLIRHGKDDETVRGGWSDQPLTEEGIQQVERLSPLDIQAVYSSDLCRSMQTAQILAEKHRLTPIPMPQFREVNNGDLAGMKNTLALVRYPGLFWNQLDWEQCYPNGESPKLFYERIKTAWTAFSKELISRNKDVMLVTHGGVIHVILAIINNKPYNNKEQQRKVAHAEVIGLTYQNGVWEEII